LRLSLTERATGVDAAAPNRIVYDAVNGVALAAPVRVDGWALVWELGETEPEGALLSEEVDLDPGTDWLMRCDRVDFEPGGIAYRHTHPGPGIRYLLSGRIAIESEGVTLTHVRGEPWFERGPDPVLATTSADEPTAFVRVMLLPAEWRGQRTIKYVDPGDADKPKTQRATIFLEQPVSR
jgi:quercetin dioxygenase-like cupin family protein